MGDTETWFRDRRDAGRRLGARLAGAGLAGAGLVDPVVLGLPRGGVPVAVEVARALDAPLDVFVARKVGAPSRPEYGIGAVAEGGGRVVDDESARLLGLDDADVEALVRHEEGEVRRRVHRYRGRRPLPALGGRAVVLVDDGLATGVTALAALHGLVPHRPVRLVVAVPVCAEPAAGRLAGLADDVICLSCPAEFFAVGRWYENFDQTSDDEVDACLAEAGTAAP